VQLARTLVALVEPTIPALESELGQSENALCILLGKMPQNVQAELGTSAPIPSVPAKLAVGVPADLLRRRPDVRMAERQAHAQCARIGVAKAGIFPSFSLLGALGLQSSDSGRFFERESWTGAYGGAVGATGLVWYPFLVERVRVEDARFQEAMLQYKNTVLNAAREVENAQTAFLKSVEQQAILQGGSQAARRATELAIDAYRQGKIIVSVPLVALTFEAGLEEQAIAAEGAAATNLVAMYKALGGGWQVREGQDLVPEEIRRQMEDRSDWWSFAGKYDLRTAQTSDVKK